MTRIVSALLPIVLLWALAALAVHRFDDRESFVSPPDAVAEGYIRAVTSRRYDQAREYLIDPEAVTNDDLRAMQHAFESRLGRPDKIEAETISRDATRALVTVRLSSPKASDAKSVSLAFAEGGWKVEREGNGRRAA